ncbi:MAG: GPW/gp25 family protein [Phenylobacterium sp.]|nr:GPW/gp25 family protein [Phenylobacterium sp.]
MAGIDARTGRPIEGWPHVVQSVGFILTTRLGDRAMRRFFGSVTPALLGQLGNRPNLLRLQQSIAVALDLFEPRFGVLRVTLDTLDRAGRLEIHIEGEYRPRGHLGDPRPDGTRRIVLSRAPGGAGVVAQ